MDALNVAMTLLIACFVFAFVLEVLSDVLDVILYGFIGIGVTNNITLC